MPPWSWIAAIVDRRDRNGLIVVSIHSASRCPPSVVTSSPTTTSNESPRSRAIARPATGAAPSFVRSGGSIPILGAFAQRSIPTVLSGFDHAPQPRALLAVGG